jgi:hypothetical protein
VCIADEEGELAVLGPPGFVGPGALTVHGLVLERVDGGRPQLPASVAAAAEEVRLDGLVQVRRRLLEVVEALDGVRRDHGHRERGHDGDRHSEGERARKWAGIRDEPRQGSVREPGAEADQQDPDRRAAALALRELRVERMVDELRSLGQHVERQRRACRSDRDRAERGPAPAREREEDHDGEERSERAAPGGAQVDHRDQSGDRGERQTS